MKKWSYILLGMVTFGLGTVGIFLPFLPTTVFYLLTGFFWLRSSETLYQKFVQSKSYQKYVQNTLIERKITTKGMLRMFILMFIVFLIPALIVDNLIMRITLAIVYLAHVIGLSWYLKGKKKTTQLPKLGDSKD